MTNHFLGIDIGGSGIKGALVDLSIGDFASDRLRIPTPEKSTPAKVAQVVARIVNSCADQLDPDSPIGITLPAVVTHGHTRSAANIDKSWIDADAETIFAKKLGRRVVIVNDADAAGIAEARYGAAKDCDGLVLMSTLGTGIGSAIIYRGVLVPNFELGHLEIAGIPAEHRASAGAKTKEGLSYAEYIPRLQRYYSYVEELLWPDLIVVGGGISRSSNKFLPKLMLKSPVVPAKLRNRAGIIGAAYLARESTK
ncbi:MAG: ROK family protein [Propionibacteriaceae bacterium]|jgi:polyphosphate glucokinase|nr:ROK family protein [Propionibacteriaceae bacterium]